MGALDLLAGIGSAMGLGSDQNPMIDPGMSIPPENDVSNTSPKSGGLDGGFITVPGPKGSKTTLDASNSDQILKKLHLKNSLEQDYRSMRRL